MADEIVFMASYGDEKKQVKLSQPAGGGNANWHVMVGGYYFGRVWKYNGTWTGDGHGLFFEDFEIIGALIENSGF